MDFGWSLSLVPWRKPLNPLNFLSDRSVCYLSRGPPTCGYAHEVTGDGSQQARQSNPLISGWGFEPRDINLISGEGRGLQIEFNCMASDWKSHAYIMQHQYKPGARARGSSLIGETRPRAARAVHPEDATFGLSDVPEFSDAPVSPLLTTQCSCYQLLPPYFIFL